MDESNDWPVLRLPEWLCPRTERLASQLGEDHPDVRFFRTLLSAGSIDEGAVDGLNKFIVDAETDEACQMAIDLSQDCLQATALVASTQDALSDPHILHCGRGQLNDAFPTPCRNRKEALDSAMAILMSPQCPKDIWLRIDGPNGLSWDTAEIKAILATREELTLLPILP